MRAIPLATIALAFLLPLASANDWGCVRDVTPTLTIDSPAGTHYVLNELCQVEGDCLFSIWVFEESNGIAGLQVDFMLELRDDTCYPVGVEGDTIVF